MLSGTKIKQKFSNARRGSVFLMALSGGFVAGLRAGHAYNTFPLMNGHFIPQETPSCSSPGGANFLWKRGHCAVRAPLLFWLLLILIPLLWVRLRRTDAKIAVHHCSACSSSRPRSHLDAAARGADPARRDAPGGRGAALLCAAVDGARPLAER
jgi:hypothetical protein